MSNQMISISVVVEAPANKVWNAWTGPEHIVNWNFASEDWSCPSAINDLRSGGSFNWRMEAKDGSMGFDLSGKYIRVEEGQLIESIFDDGRRVLTTFQELGNGYIGVSQSFDPDGENAEEPQRQGWQSILNNFKTYADK